VGAQVKQFLIMNNVAVGHHYDLGEFVWILRKNNALSWWTVRFRFTSMLGSVTTLVSAKDNIRFSFGEQLLPILMSLFGH